KIDGITVEFIYSYKDNNETRYLSLYKTLKFKNNNELNLSNFSFATKWNDKFLVDYSKSLDDILNDVFKPGSYEV
ncbi:TcpJ, partial [Clostridium perfringens]|nr:TcpJ [Clostridium perfringens]